MNNRKKQDRMASKGFPNPVDVYVGSRIRSRRHELSISQEMLGKALGLTFQQLQKYERGDNRVSASRLYDLAAILGVQIGWFFDDMPDSVTSQRPALLNGHVPECQERAHGARGRKAAMENAKVLAGLSKPQQSALRAFLRTLPA